MGLAPESHYSIYIPPPVRFGYSRLNTVEAVEGDDVITQFCIKVFSLGLAKPLSLVLNYNV